MERTRKHRIVKMVVFVLPAMVVFLALMIWAVYALWNWLMPEIFGLKAITYWQALGLMALSWILFRGFRGPRGGRAWRRGPDGRWEKLNPAEREELLQMLRRRWEGSPPPAPEPETR